MKTYRLVKIVPAASLVAAIRAEKNFPVEESYLDDKAPTQPTSAIGFRIVGEYDTE